MVRFYAQPFDAVMRMPLRAFWALVGNVHKIEADEDRRALRIAVSCQSSEGTKAMFEEFDEKLKEVVVGPVASQIDATRDEKGIAKLKGLLAVMQ